jgi:hypothetical protein
MFSFVCDICGKEYEGVEPKKKVTKLRMIIMDPVESRDPETGYLVITSRHKLQIVEQVDACPACFKNTEPKIVEVTDQNSNVPIET